MAEQVVDRLEAVQVENADREGRRIVGAITDQAIDLVEEATMVAKSGQRIGEGLIRAFPAWLPGAKRRLHHVPVLMAVFILRLAAKRLGKVSENRFSDRPQKGAVLRSPSRNSGRKTAAHFPGIAFSRLA